MPFDSYASWLDQLKTIGLSDIIFRVESEIKEDALYIEINDTQRIRSDNYYMIIGYTYQVRLYVTKSNSPFIEKVSEMLTEGLADGKWDEKNQMYVYSGMISIAGKYET
ncbi:hypothetical protein [Lactococcus lactis]|uniref:hypothetical protein n=1 Tax=Lactococcus lactis TaxID=1358 RepID=UPI000BF33C62|nr:hypothetical protein [Lactococcus lactis]PFG84201.1 hypothetical protein BW152_09185 [Lactococcus lactis]